MKIGIIQQHNSGDVKDNRSRLAQKITHLAQQGAELVVLQELHDALDHSTRQSHRASHIAL